MSKIINLTRSRVYELTEIALFPDMSFIKVHGHGERFWCIIDKYDSKKNIFTSIVDNKLNEKHPFKLKDTIIIKNNIPISILGC